MKIDRQILKAKLKEYLLEVLREEDDIQTIEDCRKEVIRVEGYLLERGVSFKKCAKEWLQGLPIGIDYITFYICKLLFGFLGWKYPEYFELGDIKIENHLINTSDFDCMYWDILAEIIAENE